jgi:serine/threonine protein kinase
MLIGGKYRLKQVLGQGGMGSVFAAENTLSGKQVAIKCMHRRIAQTPEASQRFLREARASALIRHPNVVDVYDVLAEDETFYLVMELLEGEPLSALLTRETTTLPLLIKVLLGAMRGVAAAHRQGVIHRDIKPENIFLAREGYDQEPVAKVLDFGISKLQGVDDVALTAPGAALGTVSYMSTEQLSNAKDIDARADVYAFGVILYQAITGQQPFASDTYAGMIARIMTEQATPISELRPDVPARLCAVVEAAMAKQREQRTASLEEMISGLEPFADTAAYDQRPLLTSKLPQPPAQAIVVFSHTDPDTEAVRAPQPLVANDDSLPVVVPRRRRLVPALALLGAVCAAGVMWWLVTERRDAAVSGEAEGAHLVVPAPARVSVLSAAAHLPDPPAGEHDAIPSGSLPEDQRAAPPPHAQARVAKPHKPRPIAGSGKPAAKAGCHPNYYFDAQGEKHFKPECF